MVSGGPAFAVLVPFEHGEIGDPEEPEILVGIAALLEGTVPVGILLCQRDPEQSCGGINGVVVLLDLRLHAAFGLVLPWLAVTGDDYEKIAGFGSALFANTGCCLGKVFLHALEVLK